MTYITTVRDLITELQAYSLDLEVVIAESPTVSRRIIGILKRNGKVCIDPAASEMAKIQEVAE